MVQIEIITLIPAVKTSVTARRAIDLFCTFGINSQALSSEFMLKCLIK